jgi:hypothetical protein
MTKTLSIIFLFITALAFGQKKLPINYSYSSIITATDTILIQSTPQSEWPKISKIDNLLVTYILNVENYLLQRSKGNKSAAEYNKSNEIEVHFNNLQTCAKKNRVTIDLTNYKKELEYYINHPVKSLAEKQKEAIQKSFDEGKAKYQKELEEKEKQAEYNRGVQRRNDSLAIVKQREQTVFDSIEDVRYKQEVKDQIARDQIQKKHNAEIGAKKKIETEEKSKQNRIAIIEKYGSVNGEAILNHKVKIGWTQAMCLDSWGKPRDKNKTTTANLVNEQWVYSLKKYLYFDNGILTAYQE